MPQHKSGWNPTQTAQYWLEKKVYTVPLRSRSKRPKGTNWPHLRLVAEDLQNGAFKVGDNIGALWGDASDYATDLDLDMEEACEVAPYILPATFIYGRRQKPASHYVYKCIGAETRKWQTAELGTIVEIRSTGAQSVIPPSLHPDGDRYYTEEDVEFTKLARLDLERYADEITIAAVFVRHYPQAGSRHDYVHACTGALCHQSWPDKKVIRVMEAVLNVIQDEETEMKDRTGSVRNTIEHHKTGDRTKGFKSLEAWMSMPVIAALRRWTQSGQREGQLVIAPPRAQPDESKVNFDTSLLEVPGLVGDISKWAYEQSYVEQPIFGLASGITCVAMASCNHYQVSGWDTPLQPYLMVTAPTAGGKEGALTGVSRFGKRLGLPVFKGFQSYYALFDILVEEGMLCWIWDEAARYMAGARSVNSPDFQVLTHIISLYGKGNLDVEGMPGRKQSIPALENPFLIILATAQPDMLMEVLTSTARETGFVNRFLLFDTGADFPPRNLHRKTVFPAALKRKAEALRDHMPTRDFTPIEFANTATYARFQEFEDMARRRAHAGDFTWGRSNQNALILSGIAAVGVNAERPMITPELCDWAIKLTTWSNDCWDEKMRLTSSSGNILEKESFSIEKIINRPEHYLKLQSTTTNERLCLKKSLMPESIIRRNTRNMKAQRRTEVLTDLHEAGILSSTEVGDHVCYFIKKRIDH